MMIRMFQFTLPFTYGRRGQCVAQHIGHGTTHIKKYIDRQDQSHTLQLTRLAHGPGAPPNLGSWILARMRAVIRERMPHVTRLITYHDAGQHTGAIYAADNWQLVARVQKQHAWTNRPGRQSTGVRCLVKWQRTP